MLKRNLNWAELYMQSEHDDDIILAEEWALKAANGTVGGIQCIGSMKA